MVFKKTCKKCGKQFQPDGKFVKICDSCINKIKRKPPKNPTKGPYWKRKLEDI